MADAATNNYVFVVQVTGSNAGSWGSEINNQLISPLDAILGATLPVTMTSSDVTLTLAQWQNKAFKITGLLTTNLNLILPLTSAASPDAGVHAVGGHFIIDNETTGAHNIVVKTAAAGSTGVGVAQGARTVLYSDGVSVWYANDAVTLKLATTNGSNPNATTAGTAASVNTNASAAWDGSNLWVCTTSGAAGAAVWAQVTGQVPPPQGYLNTTGSTPNVGDSVGATTVFYQPYVGDLIPIWNGSTFSLLHLPGGGLGLGLSAGSQAANGLYDIFAFIGSGVPALAFGPSWLAGAGAGNQTAGSCARGTGAGSTDLTRKGGLWVNANALTGANNGASTFNIPQFQGTYLGTVYIDANAGQVTSHRSAGQNRKFGVWNAYNRLPIALDVTDPGNSYTYGTNTIRAAHGLPAAWSGTVFNVGSGTSCNGMTILTGLPEEEIYATNNNHIAVANSTAYIGIGWNSTTAFSGHTPYVNSNFNIDLGIHAELDQPPALGINTVCALENNPSANSSIFGGTIVGTAIGIANMLLRTSYRG